MALVISQSVRQKLAAKAPPVTEDEITQCFSNRTGEFLEDIREQHKSDPPTLWFISETDYGRPLKVVFIPKENGITIRTAYDPNQTEVGIYNKHGRHE